MFSQLSLQYFTGEGHEARLGGGVFLTAKKCLPVSEPDLPHPLPLPNPKQVRGRESPELSRKRKLECGAGVGNRPWNQPPVSTALCYPSLRAPKDAEPDGGRAGCLGG